MSRRGSHLIFCLLVEVSQGKIGAEGKWATHFSESEHNIIVSPDEIYTHSLVVDLVITQMGTMAKRPNNNRLGCHVHWGVSDTTSIYCRLSGIWRRHNALLRNRGLVSCDARRSRWLLTQEDDREINQTQGHAKGLFDAVVSGTWIHTVGTSIEFRIRQSATAYHVAHHGVSHDARSHRCFNSGGLPIQRPVFPWCRLVRRTTNTKIKDSKKISKDLRGMSKAGTLYSLFSTHGRGQWVINR